MILEMARVRVMAPRAQVYDVLLALQDIGQLHLTPPQPQQGVTRLETDPREEKQAWRLRRTRDDIDVVLAGLDTGPARTRAAGVPSLTDFAHWARLARRVRRAVDRERARLVALEEEQSLLVKYRHFFAAFEPLVKKAAHWTNVTAYHVVLRDENRPDALDALRRGIAHAVGDGFDLWSERLPTGELALLIVVPVSAAARVEALLAHSHVEDIPLPEGYASRGLGEALPEMAERLEALPDELQAARKALGELQHRYAPELRAARTAISDRLAEIEALAMVAATRHAVVIEGWLPAANLGRTRAELERRFGDHVAVEEVAREEWAAEDAPVVLRNPRLFRPFEVLIELLPLPRYGSIDPTPFVAVFFPMLFGIILGDVGYGAALAVLALLVHRRSRPASVLRAASEVAGACAAFAIVFGVLFGELIGDVGRRSFGMHAVLFDREEALLPFLGLAIALGFVHIMTGLVLGVISGLRHDRRHALGSGVTAVMLLLIVFALLAATEVLPAAFFTPAVIALLIGFPILVVAEGMIAPIELLATVGNVLSYARVMAIGTASVMMAVVANRMVGLMGSVLVGTLFALIFHLVNFALGLFSPAIHALRLHYVEFFGKFYSPGGTRYRPFAHAGPDARPTA